MKSYPFVIYLISLICLLNFSCNNDDDLNPDPVGPSELEVISDGKSCDDDDGFLVCETITVEDPVQLLDSDFEYLIWPNKEVGEQIIYRNALGEEFSIEITKKDHFLYEQRQYSPCAGGSIEHVSYICQQNEKLVTEFRTDFFDNKLNRFELFRSIQTVSNQVLSDTISTFTLGQERGVDNIFEFFHRIAIGTERSTINYDFEESILLEREEFKDVWDFGLFRENILAEPRVHLYYSKEEGIIGFKEDGKIWFEVE